MLNLKILYYTEKDPKEKAFSNNINNDELILNITEADSEEFLYDAVEKKQYDLLVIETDEKSDLIYSFLENNSIPLILLTKGTSKDLLIEAINSGLNFYLLKDNEGTYLKVLPALIRKAVESTSHNNKYTELFENSPFGIIFADLNGNILDANPLTLTLSGVPSVHELRHINLITYPALKYTDFPKHFLQCIAEEKVVISEMDFITRSNKKVNIRYFLKPVKDLNTSNKTVLLLIEDITDIISAKVALKESEELHRYVLENISDAIFVTDPSGNFTYICPNVKFIFEYRQDEVAKFGNISKLLGNHSFSHENIMKGYEVHNEEFTIKTKNNITKNLLVDIKQVSIKNGSLMFICRDVTDIKTAQKKILFQNSLLRQIPSAVFATDTNGNIIYWNKFSENLYGITFEEAIKKNIREILKDKNHPEIFQEIFEIVSKKGYWESEINLEQKNEEILPIFCASVIIKNSNAEITGIVATSINISHRKSIEKALIESHKLYLTLAQNLPNVAVLLYDHELRYKIAEGSAIDLKELSKLEGKTIWEALPPEVSNSLEPYYRVTLLGKQISFERQFGKRIYNIKMLPVKNEFDDIFAGMVVYNDITEQKEVEEKVKASLKEKEILLKEIHHRVKNNLQIISSLLNLQSSYIKDKSVVVHFTESQNRVKSMALIHEKLYKAENFNSIDFSEYIKNLTSYLLQIYKLRDCFISLELNVSSTSLDIETAIPCGLIVNELVSNSLKYAFDNNKKDGVISVFLDYNSNNNEYELIVKDNGKGFPEHLDFKNTSTLGLQLINSLSEQLEGKVELNNNGGTEFKITFKEIRYKER